MCGIVGVGCFHQQGLWYNQVTMFRQLLVADSLRGIDGAGIVRVSKQGETSWQKGKGSGFDLLRMKDVNSWLEKSAVDCDKFLIGHNRAASVGNKTHTNAHPFSVDHITLVHNGFISNLSEFGKKANKFDCDSEGLTYAIAKKGLKKVLENLKGAYSIVLFDEKEKTLSFARNKERPMYISVNTQRNVLLFGSELPMLQWIVARTNNTLDHNEIKELPIHTLLQFDLEGNRTEIAYEPPKVIYSTPPSTTYVSGGEDDETLWDWSFDPQTKVWARLHEPTPAPTHTNVGYLPHPQTTTLTPPKNKRQQFPNSLYGFKVNDRIQFMAMAKQRSSTKQDQWLVTGSHTTYEDLEIRLWVKGEATADTLVDVATMVTATVRGMLRDLEGTPVIFVTDPVPHYGTFEAQKDKPEEQPKLLTH